MKSNKEEKPLVGSFEEAELFRLHVALGLTPAQRLRDLEDMIDFNAEAEANNPQLQRVVDRLRR